MSGYLQEIFQLFRIGISFALVALVPGLALGFWLFPRGVLDLPERVLVSITASIALSNLVGFALIRFGNGLQPGSFALIIVILSALFGSGAFLRSRSEAQGRQAHRDPIGPDMNQCGVPRRKRYLLALLFLLPLAVISIMATSLLRNDSSLPMTEFYISPQHLDARFGGEREVGQGLSTLTVEIVNREGRPMTYRIEVWADGGRRLEELSGIQIPPGDTRQFTVSTGLASSADAAFIELRLFSEADMTALAELRLWLEASDGLNRSD